MPSTTKGRTFGINWSLHEIEEVLREVEIDNDYKTIHSNQKSSDPDKQKHPEGTPEPFCRKVTIYLPELIFYELQTLKKNKLIRSYSETISHSLNSYFERLFRNSF